MSVCLVDDKGFYDNSKSPVSPTKQPPNPNPQNFVVLSTEQIGNFVVAEVRYPDCINYEGLKVLLFKDTTEREVRGVKVLDPHFCDDDHLSPFARFEPTLSGLAAAVRLAKSYVG